MLCSDLRRYCNTLFVGAGEIKLKEEDVVGVAGASGEFDDAFVHGDELAVVVVGGLGMWQFGMWPGLGAAAAVLLAYAVFGRRHAGKLIERRVREKALYEIDLWRKLLRHGGVRLVFLPQQPSPVCISPDQSWIQFVETIMRARQPKDTASI